MNDRQQFGRRLDFEGGRVELAHGAGGKASAQLTAELFAAAFDNPWLNAGNDAAVLALPADLAGGGGRLVLSTDGHVVSPLFFPGGDIGRLAVNGTVNDLAMLGARPLALAAAFILEEGFALAELRRIVASMAAAAREVGVAVATGDTKVVERGQADRVFITTTGVGVVPAGVAPAGDRARPGDVVLVSGTMGDHGVAIMACREGLGFETALESDCAPLNTLVTDMLAVAPDIHVLRDPTRGGLAATLNEIAQQAGVGIVINERALPIRPEVASACALLGLEPLDLANEGKLVAIVAREDAPGLLEVMRRHPRGSNAAIIGEVIADQHRFVQLVTEFGGRRIVGWLSGHPLPRIC